MSNRERKICFLVNFYEMHTNNIALSLCACLGGSSYRVVPLYRLGMGHLPHPRKWSHLLMKIFLPCGFYQRDYHTWIRETLGRRDRINRQIKFLFQCGSPLGLSFELSPHVHYPRNTLK